MELPLEINRYWMIIGITSVIGDTLWSPQRLSLSKTTITYYEKGGKIMEIILAKIVTILLLAGSFALICAGLFRRKLKLSQLSGKLLLLSVLGLASYAIIIALAIWKWNSAGGSVIIAGVCSYAPAVALYRILIKDLKV